MRVRCFKGRRFNKDVWVRLGGSWEGEDDQNGTAELFLRRCHSTDEHGWSAYSVVFDVEGGKIVDVTRMAHCLPCMGRGYSSSVNRFPPRMTETAAQTLLEQYCRHMEDA